MFEPYEPLSLYYFKRYNIVIYSIKNHKIKWFIRFMIHDQLDH